MGAGEGRYAEVVYTTLPVLVEMTIWRFELADLSQFRAKIRALRKIDCFRMTNAVVVG
jgi:hypothetical protein